MAHQINPHQQKLAEKLTILNDRGIGMLTRIFNIKKVRFQLIDNANVISVLFILGMCRNEI